MTREEILAKAEERGYSVNMHNTDKSWYAMSHHLYAFILELYPDRNEFNFTHTKGIITSKTGICGSFVNDEHFKRIEKHMSAFVFNLL